jgi:uncharacterized protein (TIGR02246 family)
MRQRVIGVVLVGGLVASLAAYSIGLAGPRTGQKTTPTSTKTTSTKTDDDPGRKAILANVRAYMEAFNRQDVKAVADLFSEDCTVTESDGTQVQGRKDLEKELKDSFADEPKAKISVEVDSLTLITPEVAIETGAVDYYPDGKTLTAESKYQVTHVKRGDRWLMRDARTFSRKVLSPYDELRDLEWLVGDWVDESSDGVVESRYRWAANKAFLLQDFTVRIGNKKALTGTQRIGWDPLTKQIKSWIFDSEGGHGESLWSNVDDDTWIIEVKGVRTDGKVVTVTNQIVKLGKDRFRFDSVDRIVGEERMPDFTAVIVRKPPAAK